MSGEHITKTWTVENTWTCTSCKEENRGRDLKCQKCSSPREVDETDVVPDADAAPAVTDPELLKLAAQKENWVCEFCGSQARDLQGKCSNCAAKKEEAKEPEPDFVSLGVAERKKYEARYWERKTAEAEDKPEPSFFQQLMNNGDSLLIASVAICVIGLILFLLIHTSKVHTKVSRILWTYHVTLEQRFTRSGDGWGSPFGAFNVLCETQQHGTHDCNAHQCNPHDHPFNCRPHNCNPHDHPYDCRAHNCNPHPTKVACGSYDCNCKNSCKSKKNGFSDCSQTCSTCTKYCSSTEYDKCYDTCHETLYDTCHDTCHETLYDTCYDQCPTMDQYCHYNYYEWVTTKEETATASDHDEHWPALQAAGEEQRLIPTEAYEVDFASKDKVYTYKPAAAADFNRFNAGDAWKIEVPMIGYAKPLEPGD